MPLYNLKSIKEVTFSAEELRKLKDLLNTMEI